MKMYTSRTGSKLSECLRTVRLMPFVYPRL